MTQTASTSTEQQARYEEFLKRHDALYSKNRPKCQIQSPGHNPNYIQVLKIANVQRRNGDCIQMVSVGVREHSDRRGTVGIYTLTDMHGEAREVFDHHPERMRAALLHTEYPDLWGGPLLQPEILLSPAKILFVAYKTSGTPCFSVAPVEQLTTRRRCRAN